MTSKEYNRKYYQEHRKEILAQRKEHRKKYPQKYKEYYQKHKEYFKTHYQEHKEKYKEQSKRYYQENKEKRNKQSIKWRREHPEQANLIGRRCRHKFRMALLELLGGKCVRCGESDWRCLQIDHINGGGRKEINEEKSNFEYYRRVKKSLLANEGKYQCLCANCNMKKRYENKEGYLGIV